MDADFAKERRRILLALMLALTAGFLPVITGTWLAAGRAAEQYRIPEELGSIWFSLGFGAMSCAAIIALAIILINRYHRMLVRAATRDHVTGAFNRQAFESTAAEAISSSLRSGHPLSLVLFDLDDFKRYNDSHGHNAGDAALREVARLAERVVRRADVVARWGGDEFVILLPGCPGREAGRIAASLSSVIQAADPAQAHMPAQISVSAGVAEMQPGDRVADLIARADEAMYTGRRAARGASRRTVPRPHRRMARRR